MMSLSSEAPVFFFYLFSINNLLPYNTSYNYFLRSASETKKKLYENGRSQAKLISEMNTHFQLDPQGTSGMENIQHLYPI